MQDAQLVGSPDVPQSRRNHHRLVLFRFSADDNQLGNAQSLYPPSQPPEMDLYQALAAVSQLLHDNGLAEVIAQNVQRELSTAESESYSRALITLAELLHITRRPAFELDCLLILVGSPLIKDDKISLAKRHHVHPSDVSRCLKRWRERLTLYQRPHTPH